MSQPIINSGVDIIILAAGSSSRLGQPKQLVKVNGISLIRHVTRQALTSDCEKVSVIVGANKELLIKEIADLDISIIENKDWSEGIASSVRAGIRHRIGIENHSNAVLISLVDQYQIQAAHLNNLITEYGKNNCIIVSEYGNTFGVPALFPAQYFDELLQLKGDAGAKCLIKKYNDQVIGVHYPQAETDLDCIDDLDRLLRETKE